MSKDLAEEIGMHLGDGCLNYAMPLICKLYSLKPTVYRAKHHKTITLQYKSKRLLKFKESLCIPVGEKNEIEIPKCVLNSDYIFDFIRGLFDTAGCLHFQKKHKKIHYYPRLDITSKSQNLIFQVDKILKENGFTASLLLNIKAPASNGTQCITRRVFLYGKKNLEK